MEAIKVLFVDDEPDAEYLVKQTFRKDIKENRLDFVFAHDGVEALEALTGTGDIRIVLSDINMPRMDGLTLLSKIAEADRLIETVIISAYGDMKNIRTAMNRGAFDFLTKPIDMEDLIITLDRTIEHIRVLQSEIEERERLRGELEASQKEIIFKLSEVIEVRSKETGNHVRRVGEYVKLLAVHTGFSARDAENLKIASFLHDIGKVSVPDAILNKPAKLTPEEFDVIKTHTTSGYLLLKDSDKDVIRTAAIIAHQHHERFDGKGYPRQLKGKDIDLLGRFTAIADVFDALSSDRVYKKAWELDRVLDYLKSERGAHFDPELIDLFFDNLDAFLAVKNDYKD